MHRRIGRIGHGKHRLDGVERLAGIASGKPDQKIPVVDDRFHGRDQGIVLQRPADNGLDVGIVESAKGIDLHPAHERRIDLEGRVLGRRAYQHDRSLLDRMEQGILLGLVESVYLVYEKQCLTALCFTRYRRLVKHPADIFHPGVHRRE